MTKNVLEDSNICCQHGPIKLSVIFNSDSWNVYKAYMSVV